MAKSSFDNWARNVKAWPWNILGLLICLGLLVISVGLFYEDFTTSLMGYRMWPTAKANAWVVFLVAALPQLGQLGFGYAFLDHKTPAFFLFLMVFMGWDMLMDVYYKSYAFQTIQLSMAAIFESLTLYTLGSELLLAFSVGMVWRLTPNVIAGLSGGTRRRQKVRQMPPPRTNIPMPPIPSTKVRADKQ